MTDEMKIKRKLIAEMAERLLDVQCALYGAMKDHVSVELADFSIRAALDNCGLAQNYLVKALRFLSEETTDSR